MPTVNERALFVRSGITRYANAAAFHRGKPLPELQHQLATWDSSILLTLDV